MPRPSTRWWPPPGEQGLPEDNLEPRTYIVDGVTIQLIERCSIPVYAGDDSAWVIEISTRDHYPSAAPIRRGWVWVEGEVERLNMIMLHEQYLCSVLHTRQRSLGYQVHGFSGSFSGVRLGCCQHLSVPATRRCMQAAPDPSRSVTFAVQRSAVGGAVKPRLARGGDGGDGWRDISRT